MSKFISFANRYFLLLVFFLFSGIIIFFVVNSYIEDKNYAVREKYNDLRIYSGLIKQQIISWVDNSKLHALDLSHNKNTIDILEKIIKNPTNPEYYEALEKLKDDFNKKYKTEEVIFIRPDSLTEIVNNKAKEKTHFDTKTLEFIQQSISPQKENSIYVYYCKSHDRLHFDIISKIYDNKNNLLAILITRYEPHKSIFSVLENWDSTYKTLESLLVKKEGDSVVFLNNLRFKENTKSEFKVSVKNLEMPAVKSVLHVKKIYNGLDYRGVKVVAFGNTIDNTDWHLITKIDQDELFLSIKSQAIRNFTVAFISIIALAFLLFLLFNISKKKLYKQLYLNEKVLHETNELFKTTLYSIGDAVISTDLSGNIKHMNPVAEVLTGYLENEVIGNHINTIFKIINQENRTKVENPVDIVLEKGIIVGLANHTLLISKDGTETPIADSGAPIKDDNGNIIGVVLVFRDQTEHYLSEKLILESEEQYRLLFNNMLNGFALHEIITNEKGEAVDYTFVLVNPAFEKILGCTAKEIIGKNIKKIYPGTEDFWIKKYGDVALHNETVQFENYSVVFDKYFRVYAFSPKPGFFATVFEDISEQNRILQDLQNAKIKAEESDKLKTSFLNNISHEIRTPLNAIVGFTRLLNENDLTKERKDYFADVIIKSSNQLLSIITDIINISTIDAGHVKLNNNEVSIADLLDEICETSTANIQKSDVLFVKDIESVKDLVIICDKTKISQIVSNLLGNALKFTKKGYVRLLVELIESRLRIIVKDTGIGIEQSEQGKIFDRFRQANDTISSEFGGTGLGLSITKSYVEIMQGTIRVNSIPGKGSTFEVSIPVNLSTNNKKMEILSRQNNFIIPSHKRILVVEDEYYNYLLVRSILEKYSLDIVHAKNGKEAVEIYTENTNFDLILMDIKLPEMNGFEAAERIKKIKKESKIIAVTAFALQGDKDKALRNNCDDYLSKPIDKDRLIELTAKYLNK